jgi:hypothetical protein
VSRQQYVIVSRHLMDPGITSRPRLELPQDHGSPTKISSLCDYDPNRQNFSAQLRFYNIAFLSTGAACCVARQCCNA